jgi:hypothetical protein
VVEGVLALLRCGREDKKTRWHNAAGESSLTARWSSRDVNWDLLTRVLLELLTVNGNPEASRQVSLSLLSI